MRQKRLHHIGPFLCWEWVNNKKCNSY